MSRHLEQLDYARIVMVEKRYPAKLIRLMSMIYLQGLKDEAKMEQKLRETVKENRVVWTLLSGLEGPGTRLSGFEGPGARTGDSGEDISESNLEEKTAVHFRGESGDA